MSENLKLTGMITAQAPQGEYDKRITLITRERGKVTGFVRGARRPKSSLQAASNLFCFGTFEAIEGKNAYTIVKADIQNYFREMASDYDVNCYGCYFLELANYFATENEDGSDQLKLLYQTMKALNHKSLDNRLVRSIYELKTLTYQGVFPDVFSCSCCHKKENLHTLDMKLRGAVCDSCRGMTVNSDMVQSSRYYLDDTLRYTMQYIISADITKLYSFTVPEETIERLALIMKEYLKLYVDRELKTAAFIE